MFDLFKEWDDKPLGCKIALSTYQHVFGTEFNIGRIQNFDTAKFNSKLKYSFEK